MKKISFLLLIFVVCLRLNGQVSSIPDQVIGRGGQFTPVVLADFEDGEAPVWEVSFPLVGERANKPSWSVNATDFQFEMNVTARVFSKGEIALGDKHILAVLDQSESIRGLASAIAVGDNWVYFLSVSGNSSGEELQFVFYDSLYDQQLRGDFLSFVPNEVLGQPDIPYDVRAAIVEAEITNGILSFDLTDTDFIGTEQVVISSVVPNQAVVYDTVDLTVVSNFEPVLATIPDQVVPFGGSFADVDLSTLTTLLDDDEISYSAEANGKISVTFNGSVASFSYPDGWSGSEEITITVVDQSEFSFAAIQVFRLTVRPEEQVPVVGDIPDQVNGKGGIPRPIVLSDYVTTNNPDGIAWSFKPVVEGGEGQPSWSVSSNNFEFSMSITSAINNYGRRDVAREDLLAAFDAASGTLTGVTEPTLVNGEWFFFLTVFSNQSSNEIEFKFYDASQGQVRDINETETFVNNAVIGDPLEPVLFSTGNIIPAISGGTASFSNRDAEWVGVASFVFTATDTTTTNQLFSSDTVSIEVRDITSPQLVVADTIRVVEGASFDPVALADILFQVEFSEVTFTVTGGDAFNPTLTDDELVCTIPDADFFGSEVVTLTATLIQFPEIAATVDIVFEVSPINDAPVFSTTFGSQVISTNTLYSFEINANDIDSEDISINVQGLPAWLRFVTNDDFALLYGTPASTDVGSYTIELMVSDGDLQDIETLVLDVRDSFARWLSIESQSIMEGEVFSSLYLPDFVEKSDDLTVEFSFSGQEELEVTLINDTLSAIPPNADWFGSEIITLSIFNTASGQRMADVPVVFEVININDEPIITSTPSGLVRIDQPYVYDLVAEDVDGDQLTINVEGIPGFLTFRSNNSGGILFGTPDVEDVGNYLITFQVSDESVTVTQQFDLLVSNSSANILTIERQVVAEGAVFDTLFLEDYLEITGEQEIEWAITQGSEIVFTLTEANTVVAQVPNEDWFGTDVLGVELLDPTNGQQLSRRSVFYEVTNINDAPVITSIPSESVGIDKPYVYDFVAEDIDGDQLTISVEGIPGFLTYRALSSGGILFGTPDAEDLGNFPITFRVSDEFETVTQQFDLLVSNNSANILTIERQLVEEGAVFDTLFLEDYLEITGEQEIEWAITQGSEIVFTLTEANAVVAQIPNEDWFGTDVLGVELLDPANGRVLSRQSVAYEVTNVNDAPVITSVPSELAGVDRSYVYDFVAQDVDGDQLTINVEGVPDFLTFRSDDSGGILFGTPNEDDLGNYSITFQVSDQSLTVTQQLDLLVSNSSANILMIERQVVQEGAVFDTLFLEDYLEITGEQEIEWAIVQGSRIVFTLTEANEVLAQITNEDWFGTDVLGVELLDPANGRILSRQSVVYEVTNINDAPAIVSQPTLLARTNANYSYELRTADVDGDVLSIATGDLPRFLSFSSTGASGGVLFGTPQEQDEGLYSISFEVNDGELSTVQEFELVVSSNSATIIGIEAQVIEEGSSFDTLRLADYLISTGEEALLWNISQGQALNFELVNEHQVVASIPNGDWFGSEVLIVQLIDSASAQVISTREVTYTVQNINDEPTFMSGTIPTATVGSNYQLVLIAEDVDGDELSFTLSEAPSWLSMAPGRDRVTLFGTPDPESVGTFRVRVRVSDGTVMTSKTFLLEVVIILSAEEVERGPVIFPNPIEDIATISFQEEIHSVKVYDTAGKLVLEPALVNSQVRLGTLPAGKYHLFINDSERVNILIK